jgi:hypothetical protein
MKLIDYLPFIAIVATLFIGIITCLISFLNYQQSKKTWHVNIASARRKERIDKLVVFYSQMVAMAYPDTIKGYAIKVDYSFVEKIVESYGNLNMLLDHRFPHDTELAYASKKLTQAAIDYFNSRIFSSDCDSLDTEYRESFHVKMTVTDKLCNIFIGVEWTRVEKEVQKGLPIPAEEWAEQYINDTAYYEQWDEKYRQ